MSHIQIHKILLIILLVQLSACCIQTATCDCDPPTPELTKETLAWINPFDEQAFFLFENESGDVDTVSIERQQRTDYMGGDECGVNAQTEIAILRSLSADTTILTFICNRKFFVWINEFEENDNYLVGYYNTDGTNMTFGSPISSGGYNGLYDWQDDLIPAIVMNCTDTIPSDTFECNEILIRDFVIAKDFGLIKFIDAEGEEWERSL